MDTRTGDVVARRAGDPTGGEPARACHGVLLALAGRVPDRSLWRLRDWLAQGATVALRTALPRTLVRLRVGLTDAERALLLTAVTGWGGPERLVDGVLHLEEAPPAAAAFAPDGPRPGWDAVDLALRALAPGPGVREVRRAWRRDGAADRATPPAAIAPPLRVVLVRIDDEPDAAVLTGSLQRGLRALGEADPRVEVVTPTALRTTYHQAAVAGSELLWTPVDGYAGTPRQPAVAGELVPHG